MRQPRGTRCAIGRAQPLQQIGETLRPPEMALQPRPPCRGDVQRIDQSRKQRCVADLNRKFLQPRRAQSFNRKRQHLRIGRGPVLCAEIFHPGLQELRRSLRAACADPEYRAVAGKARRELAAIVEMHAANRNRQFGPEAEFTPFGIGQQKCPSADFLA